MFYRILHFPVSDSNVCCRIETSCPALFQSLPIRHFGFGVPSIDTKLYNINNTANGKSHDHIFSFTHPHMGPPNPNDGWALWGALRFEFGRQVESLD
jgi:hypothetical protein